MAKRTRHVVILMTLVLASGAGCGSSGGQGSAADAPNDKATSAATSAEPTTTAPTATPTADEAKVLRTAVKKYSDAYLTGDATTAFNLLSARCQKRMSAAAFADIVRGARDMYGSALPIKTFDAQISGDLARVTYTYDVKAINQDSEPWVREDGKWHEDDC